MEKIRGICYDIKVGTIIAREGMCVQRNCEIVTSQQISGTSYAITIDAPDMAGRAVPGQFLHILCDDAGLLRRPISICSVSGGHIRFIFDVVGKGTRWLANKKSGMLDIIGPLGSGYDLQGKRILAIGGGIGVPPMLFAASRAIGMVTAVLGFKTEKQIILHNEFRGLCKQVHITTDDGSFGEKGFVSRPVSRLLETGAFDSVLACGPRPMLKSITEIAAIHGVDCQVSLEERMGCGVGACLVCACRVKGDKGERYARVCKDGPVFSGSEVVWDE